MLLNPSHKFLFIHIPKTGGNSIKYVLNYYNDQKVTQFNNPTITEGIEKKDFIASKGYYRFSFVRNPWDRFVSAFLYLKNGAFSDEAYSGVKNKQDRWWAKRVDRVNRKRILENGGGDMEEFLKSGFNFKSVLQMKPQSAFLLDNGKNMANYVGRYETLEEDFDKVCKHLGLDLWTVPLLNKTEGKSKDYTDYFNEETKEIIAEAYKDDIEMFDYKFGEDLSSKHWRSIGQRWTQKRNRKGLDHIREGDVCLEAGAWKGHLSEQILKRNPSELHLIDLWAGDENDWGTWGTEEGRGSRRPNQREHFVNEGMEKIYQGMKDLFGKDDRVTIYRNHSRGVPFPKEHFDWVYIDADHSYQSVLADLRHYYPLMKKGGYICGDDYYWPGIRRAVDEFAKEMGLEKLIEDRCHSHGGYDQYALLIK